MANGQDSGCAARCSSTRSAAMIDWLETLLRISIGAFLLTAALAKLRLGPDAFAAAIEGYRIVPRSLGPLAARAITLVELVVGAALALGVLTPIAAAGAGSLLLLFAAAMAASLARGRHGECGCGAFFRRQVLAWPLVYRNVVIAALLLPTSSWAAPLLASAVVAAATVFLLAHGWSVLATRTQVISTGGER